MNIEDFPALNSNIKIVSNDKNHLDKLIDILNDPPKMTEQDKEMFKFIFSDQSDEDCKSLIKTIKNLKDGIIDTNNNDIKKITDLITECKKSITIIDNTFKGLENDYNNKFKQFILNSDSFDQNIKKMFIEAMDKKTNTKSSDEKNSYAGRLNVVEPPKPITNVKNSYYSIFVNKVEVGRILMPSKPNSSCELYKDDKMIKFNSETIPDRFKKFKHYSIRIHIGNNSAPNYLCTFYNCRAKENDTCTKEHHVFEFEEINVYLNVYAIHNTSQVSFHLAARTSIGHNDIGLFYNWIINSVENYVYLNHSYISN